MVSYAARTFCIFALLIFTACGERGGGDIASAAPGSGVQAEGFDWGGDCSFGDGEFHQTVVQGATVRVGDVAKTKRGVAIQLTSSADVDVQLIDRASGTEIIAWPNGLLSGAGEACASFEGTRYCYSGYNGGQTADTLGHEWIRIDGDTNRELVMRAFGYGGGDATVTYSWQAVPTCNEKGDGAFAQAIDYYDTVTVGTIPTGKVNVSIELRAEAGADVDVQLYDGDTALVQWPSGALSGHDEESLEHYGMQITYSGYNGIDGDWGHERIDISGRVSRTLTMKAFGYQAGTAEVTYAWGVGAGATCGGIAALQCIDGMFCKAWQDGVADAAGSCHTQTWCENNESAGEDCHDLMHIAVPGIWTCRDFECAWQTSGPMPVCSYQDPAKRYVGTSTEQCAAMRFACESWRQPFSDPCGCGCVCPAVIDCEGGACDQHAIAADCPNSTIAL